MSGKEPSAKESKRAVRFLRHVENCKKCSHDTVSMRLCRIAYGWFVDWDETYYDEVVEVNEAKRKGLPRS